MSHYYDKEDAAYRSQMAKAAPKEFQEFVGLRSEEHTSELQSLMRISYAVLCLKKKNTANHSPLNTDLLTDKENQSHTYLHLFKNHTTKHRKSHQPESSPRTT